MIIVGIRQCLCAKLEGQAHLSFHKNAEVGTIPDGLDIKHRLLILGLVNQLIEGGGFCEHTKRCFTPQEHFRFCFASRLDQNCGELRGLNLVHLNLGVKLRKLLK